MISRRHSHPMFVFAERVHIRHLCVKVGDGNPDSHRLRLGQNMFPDLDIGLGHE